MATLLLPPWPSYNSGAISQDSGPAPIPPIEALTIVAVDTGLAGANFIEVSTPPTLVLLGDRIEQGAAQGFVQGIIGPLIFLDTVAGFSAGSAQAYDDAGGTPIDFATFNRKLLGTCIGSYVSDVGITTSSGRVTNWANQGTLGAALDMGQFGASNNPYYSASDANFNNYPSLEFKGATEANLLWKDSGPGGAPAVTAVDTFLVIRLKNDPPPSSLTEGPPISAQALNMTPQYPRASDGVVVPGAFSNAVKTMINPTISLATTHLTEWISTASEYTWRLNGTQQATTGTNTVAWDRYTIIGLGSETGVRRFNGYAAEWFIYSAKLSTNYRMIFEYCVEDRYGIDIAGV